MVPAYLGQREASRLRVTPKGEGESGLLRRKQQIAHILTSEVNSSYECTWLHAIFPRPSSPMPHVGSRAVWVKDLLLAYGKGYQSWDNGLRITSDPQRLLTITESPSFQYGWPLWKTIESHSINNICHRNPNRILSPSPVFQSVMSLRWLPYWLLELQVNWLNAPNNLRTQ